MNINFNLILHDTYRNTGFFNIKREYDRYFGEHNSMIKIFIEDRDNPINGRINRTANNNNTARIMGGVKLKEWFRTLNHLQNIKVIILNDYAIKIEVQR